MVDAINAIRQALEVRIGVRGDPRDAAVTFRDLESAGIAELKGGNFGSGNGGGGKPPGGGLPDGFLQPPRPRPRPISSIRNIRTRAVWDGIMVLWDPPSPEEQNTEYASVEIYAAQEVNGVIPSFSQATLVGASAGTLFIHSGLGLGRVYWYWLRKVGFTYAGTTNYGAYTPDTTARGVRGASSEDPALVVDILQGQIYDDMLRLDLHTRIATGTLTPREPGARSIKQELLDAVQLIDGRVAAIQEQTSIVSDRQGVLEASYGIKIDVDGYVAGFGLLVRDNGAGGIEQNTNPDPGNPRFESAFVIAADRFGVVFPQQPGQPRGTPVIPFTVGRVNGIPTVGIEGRLMVDGSITATAINAETIGASEVFATSIWAGIVRARRVIGEEGIATGEPPDYRVEIGNRNSTTVLWYGRGAIGGSETVFDFDNQGNVRLAGELTVTGRIRSAGAGGAYVQVGGTDGFAFWTGAGEVTEQNARLAVRADGNIIARGLPLTVPTAASGGPLAFNIVAPADGGLAPVVLMGRVVWRELSNARDDKSFAVRLVVDNVLEADAYIVDDQNEESGAMCAVGFVELNPGPHVAEFRLENIAGEVGIDSQRIVAFQVRT